MRFRLTIAAIMLVALFAICLADPLTTAEAPTRTAPQAPKIMQATYRYEFSRESGTVSKQKTERNTQRFTATVAIKWQFAVDPIKATATDKVWLHVSETFTDAVFAVQTSRPVTMPVLPNQYEIEFDWGPNGMLDDTLKCKGDAAPKELRQFAKPALVFFSAILMWYPQPLETAGNIQGPQKEWSSGFMDKVNRMACRVSTTQPSENNTAVEAAFPTTPPRAKDFQCTATFDSGGYLQNFLLHNVENISLDGGPLPEDVSMHISTTDVSLRKIESKSK